MSLSLENSFITILSRLVIQITSVIRSILPYMLPVPFVINLGGNWAAQYWHFSIGARIYAAHWSLCDTASHYHGQYTCSTQEHIQAIAEMDTLHGIHGNKITSGGPYTCRLMTGGSRLITMETSRARTRQSVQTKEPTLYIVHYRWTIYWLLNRTSTQKMKSGE